MASAACELRSILSALPSHANTMRRTSALAQCHHLPGCQALLRHREAPCKHPRGLRCYPSYIRGEHAYSAHGHARLSDLPVPQGKPSSQHI